MKRIDLLHHAVYSFALAIAGAFLFGGLGWGVLFSVSAGAFKEARDYACGCGTPEWRDIVSNVIGIVVAAYIMWRWGV